ncbi:MAG: tyrosine-type recombinase/integrase [Erysipelotrichaceae bacterium]|nr:tyrosine-type recombinase/integrase [Erysipelotrichaceae bacterium]
MATMKFANGCGSVVKLSGKRRKPYIIRAGATYRIDENGNLKEERKIIGYASSKQEAFKILTDFFANPYDLDKSKITFSELYDEWSKSYYLGVSESTVSYYTTAYKHCYALYNKPYRDIKLMDYQRMFDEAKYKDGTPLSQDSLKRIKVFLGAMGKYALQNEIITKDYSKFIDVKRYKNRESKKVDREVFTDKEIVMLWAKQRDPIAQIVLCLIYTGTRIKKEFFNIKKADVDLDEHYIHIVQSKTENGIRWIPIPDTIYPFIKEWYEYGDSEYLFHTKNGTKFDYSYFLKDFWKPFMESMHMDHKPYDCRHTYNSLLANLEINTDIRETLMGQSSGKVNVKVYTHYQKEKLLEIVNRL